MVRQILSDVYWLHECYGLKDAGQHHGLVPHEHISVYAIYTERGWIVVDTGSFHHRESLLSELDRIVGTDSLAAIILSHSDYPHSANIGELREAWDDVELVASSGAPAIQGLPEATRCRIGEHMDVAGRPFEFIDPPLADRSHTTWIYDTISNTMFTADGFGNWHNSDECEFVSADFDQGIPTGRVQAFHRETLPWLRYVDPDRLMGALAEVFDSRRIELVAPVHGNPIVGGDLADYLDALSTAASQISEAYDVETGE